MYVDAAHQTRLVKRLVKFPSRCVVCKFARLAYLEYASLTNLQAALRNKNFTSSLAFFPQYNRIDIIVRLPCDIKFYTAFGGMFYNTKKFTLNLQYVGVAVLSDPLPVRAKS